MPHRPRSLARAAGILYLVTHVTSTTAVLAYTSGWTRGGVTLEFALAMGCLGTGVLLWVLLRDSGPTRAAAFALLRAVEAAVIIAGALPMVATLWLDRTDAGWSEALAAVHTASFLLGQGLVIGVNTIVLGWLLWDSRRVPRGLALLGIIGGVLVLASDLGQLWAVVPLNGSVAGVAAVPIFAFEIWLAISLIAVGLRPAGVTPRTSAPASAPTA